MPNERPDPRGGKLTYRAEGGPKDGQWVTLRPGEQEWVLGWHEVRTGRTWAHRYVVRTGRLLYEGATDVTR